jgi:hypothetical protein
VSDKVDELFGKGGEVANPRVGLAYGLLAAGVALALIGSLCTSIPGGVLVLVSWLVVQRDLDRIESGYLPADHGTNVRNAQIACALGIFLVIGLEVFQMMLYGGAFQDLLMWFLAQFAWLIPEAPPPAP